MDSEAIDEMIRAQATLANHPRPIDLNSSRPFGRQVSAAHYTAECEIQSTIYIRKSAGLEQTEGQQSDGSPEPKKEYGLFSKGWAGARRFKPGYQQECGFEGQTFVCRPRR
jgi:hypothetical protein